MHHVASCGSDVAVLSAMLLCLIIDSHLHAILNRGLCLWCWCVRPVCALLLFFLFGVRAAFAAINSFFGFFNKKFPYT